MNNHKQSEIKTEILRIEQVKERTGLSRSNIYDRMNPESPRFDPCFPRQIKISSKAVGWSSTAVDAWIASRFNVNQPAIVVVPLVTQDKTTLDSKLEPITARATVTADKTQLFEQQIITVREYLIEQIRKGIPRVSCSEVMATIHLWENKPEDRAEFDKILERVIRTSHTENGILLGVNVCDKNKQPSETFFILARALGYAFDDQKKFCREEINKLYSFYDTSENKGKVRWLEYRNDWKERLIREKL